MTTITTATIIIEQKRFEKPSGEKMPGSLKLTTDGVFVMMLISIVVEIYSNTIYRHTYVYWPGSNECFGYKSVYAYLLEHVISDTHI